MSMMIGGIDSNVKRMTLKKADGTVAGTISVSKPKEVKKKKLSYNFKEISNQILQTKTSVNAQQVVSRAFSQVVLLRLKYRTGQYDDEEVRHAIEHAEQMARVAKKRMKHLQEEESAGKHGGVCRADLEEETKEIDWEELDGSDDSGISEEELKELMQELKKEMRDMEELAKEMSEDLDLDDLTDEVVQVVRKEMDPEDLELLKKKHRAEELREIMEADMKYLKAVFDKLAKEKQENSNGSGGLSGVSLEIGGLEMPVEIGEAAVMTEGGGVDVSV